MSFRFPTIPGLDRKVLLILAAALALRLAYGLSRPDALFYPDSTQFDELAWNLAANNQYGIGGPTAVRPPAYVVFLAGVYKLAGHSRPAALAAQALIGTLLVFILMRVAGRLSGPPSLPLITGCAAAFYPFFVYYEGQLLADSFLTFVMSLSLWLFIRWKENPLSWTRAVAFGLALSATVLTKTPMLLWAALIFLTETVSLRSLDDRAARFARILTAALVLSIPLLGWGARNKAALGQFSLDNHGGATLAGTIIFHAQTKADRLGETARRDPFFLEADKLPEAERERYFFAATRRFIQDHPGRYFYECLTRFKDFWRFYPRPDVQFREGALRLIIISLLTEPFLILAGLFTLFLTRPAWPLIYPASCAVVWLTLLHTLITGQMRYRLPLMPFLILGAAHWLASRKTVFKTARPTSRSAEVPKSS
jgi:4-amino-4-deoxy-L-arabinose transferase-like glycosyltransferase